MGILDLFKRRAEPVPETRSSATGFTAAIMAARESYITGASAVGELTATVQSCVTLYENGLALADVKGTDLLDRRTMAMIGRSLALRGEAVFLIRDRLVACADWDLSTRDGTPRAYRVSVSDVGGPRSETVLAGEVLHLRIGSDLVTPWAGQAPLMRARLSASLLHEVESALHEVFRDAPLGSKIAHVPEGSADDMETMRRTFKGRRGSTLVIEGTAQAAAAGMHPNMGKAPDDLSPDLSRAMTGETLEAARGAVLAAFGVLPALYNVTAQAGLVREAQRHLAQLILQPIAGMMAEEATAKLGARVQIDVVRPMQAYDAGGKARALATMIGALAQAREAGIEGATLQDAMSFIDWADE